MRPLFAFCLPLLCVAQTPTVGIVEIYGARKVPLASVQKIVNVAPGGRLPGSKAALEEDLTRIPGVHEASVEAACCENGRIILYIGIAEGGPSALTFRPNPTEGPDIPEAVTAAYRGFIDEVNEAARSGVPGEDLSAGHSLMTYAPAREAQLKFLPLAKQFSSELKAVLRTSSSEDHRAMAAYVLQYHDDKRSVVEDLIYALRDGDATVRGNAVRALAAFASYTPRPVSAAFVVDATEIAALLNSAVWTDRNNAAVALVSMTPWRTGDTLAVVRKTALPSLIEMARWKHLPHALPAYILLGRTAGIPETELQSAWSAGERERIIVRAAGRPSAPSKPRSTLPGRP